MSYCGPILKNLFYLGGLDTRTGENMRRMNVVRTINCCGWPSSKIKLKK